MALEPADRRPAPAPRFTVGNWQVDPATDTVFLAGRSCKLEPRTMRLLVTLAARPGQVLTGEALLDAVWPKVVVTSQSLYQAIGELRAVLKADEATAEFIATVPRKGYRLVAPVGPSVNIASAGPVSRPLVPGSAAVPSEDAVAPGHAHPAASTRVAASDVPASGGSAASIDVSPTPATRSVGRKIAVLPFRDLGVSPALSFLRETLLAGLIQELSRQPDLSPIARGTMLFYRDQPATPRRIAADLDVRYVLDGTITQVSDDLLIGCELVDARDDSVLASETLQVPSSQWPEVSRQVVGRLARSARLQSSIHAVRDTDAIAPERLTALELAMRAWVELYCRPQTRETNDRAWRWAREALDRDVLLGPAWNVLAYCEWRAAQYGWSDRERTQLLADAVDHAQRATVLSPEDPDAHHTLGLAIHTIGEFARAEGTLRHCLEISSSYAPAYGLLGLVRVARGYPEDAAPLCRRAFELSPREPLRIVWYWVLGLAASMQGRDEEALEHASRGIAANPDFPSCYLIAAVCSMRLGKADQAARYVSVLRRSSFSSIERVRGMVPSLRVEPWGSIFLADLHAAGLPER